MSKQESLHWSAYAISKQVAEDAVAQAKENKEELSIEKAFADTVQTAREVLDEEWERLCDTLTEWMERKNKTPYWRVDGRNMGWDHRSGYKYFRASTGKELLDASLPKTDNIFTIYHDGRFGLRIVNANHDTMGETYFVRAATKREQEEGHFD